MASIATERGSVNAKAVFAAALAETQDELVKRLGEQWARAWKPTSR